MVGEGPAVVVGVVVVVVAVALRSWCVCAREGVMLLRVVRVGCVCGCHAVRIACAFGNHTMHTQMCDNTQYLQQPPPHTPTTPQP